MASHNDKQTVEGRTSHYDLKQRGDKQMTH